MATWVEQYAQKPCERPSASTVLARLEECVDDWWESIIPPISEEWENIGSCSMFPNDWQFVHAPATDDDDGLTIMASGFHNWTCYLVDEGSE